MIVFDNHLELRTNLRTLYCNGKSIGFVPTMGALHVGHGTLISRSVAENDFTVVSIFVNPTQFGPNEDLDQYPRTLESDLKMCRSLGASHVFTPTPASIYPNGRNQHEIMFSLRGLDKILCGAKRPGHFDGVLQVVSILFNIVEPTRAYFGKKDFQQLTILRILAKELFFPVEVIPCEIIRETDGLAMSSRNRYLNLEERKQALFLRTSLQAVQNLAEEGMDTGQLHALVTEKLSEYPLIRLDYFDVRKELNLEAVSELRKNDHPVALIAAYCGKTRLIDNLHVFK